MGDTLGTSGSGNFDMGDTLVPGSGNSDMGDTLGTSGSGCCNQACRTCQEHAVERFISKHGAEARLQVHTRLASQLYVEDHTRLASQQHARHNRHTDQML